MRGVVIAVLAIIFVAANITTYEPQDSFTVDDTLFTIEHLVEQGANIRTESFARIWRVDDCEQTTHYTVCLEAVSEETADIRVVEINRSYTLTRSIPEQVVIGEPFRVELTLENHAPERRIFTLQDRTDAQTSRHTGINQDLYWSGIISANSVRTMYYDAIITRPTTFSVFVKEPYNTTKNHTVDVEDFVSVHASWVNQTTTRAEYPFRFTVDSDEDAELFIRVSAPRIDVSERKNLTQQLTASALSNETAEYGFTYSVAQGVETNISVEIVAETSHATTTRTYHYPVRDAFSPVTLIHDYAQVQLSAHTNHTLTLSIHNPNEQDVAATLTASSVLIDLKDDILLPAQGVVERELVINPNSTDSDYTIHLALTYEDANGAQTRVTDRMRIQSTPPHTTPNTTPQTPVQPPSITLSAQETSQGFSLLLTPQHFTNDTGQLVIERYEEIVFSDTVWLNQTFTYQNATPGTYTARVQTAQENVTEQYTIQNATAPTQEPPTQEVVEENGLGILPLFTGVLLIMFVIIMLRIEYNKKRAEQLIRTYESTKEVLSKARPQTPQEFALKQELHAQLKQLEEEIMKYKG